MTIQLDGTVVSTTMRTPGNDYELAVGFCHTEGLLAGVPVTGVRYCATGAATDTEFNVVTVDTGGRRPMPTPRLGTTSSSCGWCGSEQLDDMCARLRAAARHRADAARPARPRARPRARAADRCSPPPAPCTPPPCSTATARSARPRGRRPPQRRRQGRRRDAARPASCRPPVAGCSSAAGPASRWCRRRGRPGSARSSRSARPTALAVDAARRANLLLAGFVRGDRFNVYAPERLPAGTPAAIAR